MYTLVSSGPRHIAVILISSLKSYLRQFLEDVPGFPLRQKALLLPQLTALTFTVQTLPVAHIWLPINISHQDIIAIDCSAIMQTHGYMYITHSLA